MGIFLIALDQTILATALPKIVTHFNALSQVTWVSSGFILTQTAFMPFFGQVTSLFIPKYVFLVGIVTFEVGSVLCAAAPDIQVLILGRALAGVGASGLMVSMVTLMTEIVTLDKRPMLMGIFGSVFGLASVVGPLIGGAFTDHVTWRWCFYINLPLGALAVISVALLIKVSTPKGLPKGEEGEVYLRHPWKRVFLIDWVGMVIALGSVTCLVLGTTWGPVNGWSDGKVIATITLACVLAISFALWEWRMGEDAMVPFSIFRKGTFSAVVVNTAFSRWVMFVPVYYLPIHFQAVNGRSATGSGLDLLGIILSMIIFGTVNAAIVKMIDMYTPFLIAGPILSMVGAGLLFTINPSTPFSHIVGYEILVGVGIGCFFQLGMLAGQAEFADEQYRMGKVMGVLTLHQMLGAVIGLAIGGSVFDQKLQANLAKFAPGVDPIVASSPTVIRQFVSTAQLPGVLKSYDLALRWAYLSIVPVGGVALIAAFFVKNRSLKPPGAKGKKEKKDLENGTVNGTAMDVAESAKVEGSAAGEEETETKNV
jgi:EmrB/QacA subfamily drug resistance transporter